MRQPGVWTVAAGYYPPTLGQSPILSPKFRNPSPTNQIVQPHSLNLQGFSLTRETHCLFYGLERLIVVS